MASVSGSLESFTITFTGVSKSDKVCVYDVWCWKTLPLKECRRPRKEENPSFFMTHAWSTRVCVNSVHVINIANNCSHHVKCYWDKETLLCWIKSLALCCSPGENALVDSKSNLLIPEKKEKIFQKTPKKNMNNWLMTYCIVLTAEKTNPSKTWERKGSICLCQIAE